MKIVLATRNPGKLKELQQLLELDGIEYVPVSDFDIDDVEETGKTFIENAVLKASFAAKATGLPAIGDDSGMELPGLNGYPGIYSARCAGENATNEELRQHILEKMKDISDRSVKFVCALSFMTPDSDIPSWFSSDVSGQLLEEARGVADTNIQYDSLFYVPDMEMTFAEMTKEEKNKISHRGKACEHLKDYLKTLVKG